MNPKTIKRLHPAMRDDIDDLRTQRPLPGVYAEQIDRSSKLTQSCLKCLK